MNTALLRLADETRSAWLSLTSGDSVLSSTVELDDSGPLRFPKLTAA